MQNIKAYKDLLLFVMSFIKALMNFLRKLFGGSTVQSSTQTVKLDSSKCMKEDVIDFLANGHDQDERGRIRAYIKEQESKGIYEYSFSTSRWYFEVKNGQFKSSNNPEDMTKNRI